MGVVKYSGPVASFHCPTEATIRSLKVHFSPKQEGSGDPSPENVRPIVGWDGVEVMQSDDMYCVPSGYQRVEYLRIMANAHFDSNYVPTIAPRIVTKIQIMSSADADLFGFANNIEPSFIVDPSGYGNNWFQRWGKTNYTNIGVKKVETPTICEFGKQQIFDGEVKCIFSDADWSSNVQSIRIGGARNTTSDMRLYYCDIYDGTNLMRRLVPCQRKSDNVLGLYDMVSNTFLTKQGSGNLECGLNIIGQMIDYEFGVLGKNKLNADAEQQAPDNTNMLPANKRIFTQNTYCVGMSWSNYYVPNNVTSYSVSNGTITVTNANVYGLGYPVRVVPGQAYHLSATTTNGRAHIAYFAADGTYISGVSTNVLNSSFTVPSGVETAVIVFYSSSGEATFSNIQLELGSSATSYEPYDPKHTVYGGWVDLISGEVCEEYNKITIDGETRKATYTYKSNGAYGAGYVYVSPEGKSVSYKDGIPTNMWCENLPLYIGMKSIPAIPYMYAPLAGALYTVFYLASVEDYPELEDASARREYVNNWLKQNPVTIVYELATPNIYYIAPTALQTFLGHNNVWSNADYVEVEYDLHETQTILARKQFIMANQPHIVKPAAAPLQNFVTDLVAPLKECKIYFSPVQEGSGDPSPDNVRAISGWNDITLYTDKNKNLFDQSHLLELSGWTTTTNVTSPNGTTVYTGTIRSMYDSWKNHMPTDCAFKENTRYVVGLWWRRITPSTSNGMKFIIVYTDGTSTTATNQSNNTENFIINYLVSAANKTVDYIRLTYGTSTNVYVTGMFIQEYENFENSYPLPSVDKVEVSLPETVYGGYVDLATGELVKTHEIITINGIDISLSSGFNIYNDFATGYGNIQGQEATSGKTQEFILANFKSDKYPIIFFNGGSNPTQEAIYFPLTGNNNFVRVYIATSRLDDISTTSAAKTSFQNYIKNNPFDIVYPLATPIHYQLTPTQLKTLRGTNNIWASNGGDNLEIAYWKH